VRHRRRRRYTATRTIHLATGSGSERQRWCLMMADIELSMRPADGRSDAAPTRRGQGDRVGASLDEISTAGAAPRAVRRRCCRRRRRRSPEVRRATRCRRRDEGLSPDQRSGPHRSGARTSAPRRAQRGLWRSRRSAKIRARRCAVDISASSRTADRLLWRTEWRLLPGVRRQSGCAASLTRSCAAGGAHRCAVRQMLVDNPALPSL
jgi:hypothetical protein